MIAGAAVADGVLWAVGAAHPTVLTIHIGERTLAAAYAVPRREQPMGITVRRGELLVAQEDGRVAVVARP